MIARKETILGYYVFTEERLLDKSVLNFLYGHLGSLSRESKDNVVKKTNQKNKYFHSGNVKTYNKWDVSS